MIRINPKHQADCQVLNLCQVILIKEEFRNVIWHFLFFSLSKMIHLRDMHSASLKKKKKKLVNLHWLTYQRNLCHILLKLPSLKKNLKNQTLCFTHWEGELFPK